MNKLKTDKRAQILNCLVEGNSLRATARLTGAAINTVVKMLCDAGRAFSLYQDEVMRNLKCKRIQCDEIWAFIGCKEKNVTPEKRRKDTAMRGRGLLWMPTRSSCLAGSWALATLEPLTISSTT